MMLGLCCRADCDLLSLYLTNNNKITSLPHRSKPACTPFSWAPLIWPSVNYTLGPKRNYYNDPVPTHFTEGKDIKLPSKVGRC